MTISKRISTLITIGVIAFVWSVFFCFTPFESTRSNAQNQSALTFEVSTYQKNFARLEPITLKCNLSNQTSAVVKWNGYLGLAQNVNLLSRSETGTEVKWIGEKKVLEYVFSQLEVLQPGKNKEKQILLDGYLAESLFPLPGRYQLQVEYIYFDISNEQQPIKTAVSTSVNIEIKEPQGIDRKAFDYIKSNYQVFISRGSGFEEAMRAEQFFVNNFGGSVYWKYVTFNLGNRYMRMKEYEKADQLFYEISDVDFYYSEEVKHQLWVLSPKLNRPNIRTKRLTIPQNIPTSRPIIVKPAVRVPLPADFPVLIPIPNPNPNPNSTPKP